MRLYFALLRAVCEASDSPYPASEDAPAAAREVREGFAVRAQKHKAGSWAALEDICRREGCRGDARSREVSA
jgi:hypothetical protein